MDDVLFERLLYEEEGPTLDFKKEQYRFVKASDDDKSELLKDILGFANSRRRSDAYILIGVEDIRGSRKNVVGIETGDHLDDHAVQQFVNNLTNRPVRFRYEAFGFEGMQVGIIIIEEHQPRPLFLKKDYGKLKRNEVYVRRGSSIDPTKPAQPDEIAMMGQGSGPQTADLVVQFADIASDTALGTQIVLEAEFCEMPPMKSIPDLTSKHEGHRLGIDYADPFNRPNEDYFRELAQYECFKRLFQPVRLVVHNVGPVAADEVRVEMAVPTDIGGAVLDSSELPDPPRRRADPTSAAMKRIRPPFRRAPGEVCIDKDEERYGVTIDCGGLQPGRRVWSEAFYVGRRTSGDVAFVGQVLANNLRQPKEFTLRIAVNVTQTKMSVGDLKSLPDPHEDE